MSRDTSMNTSDTACDASPLQIEATTSDHAIWITVRGEADIANHEQLQAALAAIDFDGTREVHLRLSDLTFCDVQALGHLVNFGSEVRRTGRDLAVHDANRLVQKVTRLIGADDVLRFE